MNAYEGRSTPTLTTRTPPCTLLLEVPVLRQWFYVSSANVESVAEVQRIIRVSRDRNAAHSVTGLLVYSGDHFAQVIEGPPGALDTIIASIRRDARHQIIWERLLTDIRDRWFGDWSMGYIYNDSLETLLRRVDQDGGLPALDELVPTLLRHLVVNARSRTRA